MNLSYWEIKSWFTDIDYTIVGSGIVGLNCALNLKRKLPKANILILEKGILPQGASTKNAGFACFGSLSEIIEDLKDHSEEEVVELIKKRWLGLQLLRNNLGDRTINFYRYGGYELFHKGDGLWEECLAKKDEINKLLKSIFKSDVFTICNNKFKFSNIKDQYIFNKFEGQLDTGKMMSSLLQKALSLGIKIINNCTVKNYVENNNGVAVKTNKIEFTTKNLLITTNGFTQQLLNEEVKPARAQVLITKQIKNLHIKGTFHLDKGYYYFRNIDNRILFGGARNVDFESEETSEFGLTKVIQDKLEDMLKTIILPKKNIEIEHKWSGIMGVGDQKKAIVKKISNHVACGVRLGGMGVAIGSIIGKELAEVVSNK